MTGENHIAKSPQALLGLVIASLGVFLLAYACEKPNNEIFTDEGEILSLMENNLDAREIFEAQIFPSDSVLVDSSTGVLRMLSFTDKRRFPLSASVQIRPVEIENFGPTFVARASVRDKFFGDYIQRLNGQPDLFKLWDGVIDRKALLFKLGDDNTLYLGWELVGYNTGRPLALIGVDVKIRVFPTNGGTPRIISDKPRENLPPDLLDFTLFIHVDALRSGERVEIETVRQKFSIFARTAQGFRQLEPTGLAGGKYKYSFIVPPPDPGRFFHLMTFQSGPEITIDSLWDVFLETLSIDTLDWPDSTIDTTVVVNSMIVPVFLLDTTFIDSSVDPWIVNVDSVPEPDSLIVETLDFRIDTILDSFDNLITHVDSNFVDTSHIFDFGDIWTFPYSVR